MKPVRGRIAIGVTLIILGLGLYGAQYLEALGRSLALCLLGAACVAAYLLSRAYPLLVIGGIVLGLGIGSFIQERMDFTGEATRLGLGIGFVLIYLIALAWQRRSHWWPLVLGGVLLLLGFRAWRPFRQFLFSEGWPLILVIVGALVLLGSVGRDRKDEGAGAQ